MNDLSFQIPTNRLNARGLIRHPIRQYAWFVDDIDEACHKWNKMLGAGPARSLFRVVLPSALPSIIVSSKPALTIRTAFARRVHASNMA